MKDDHKDAGRFDRAWEYRFRQERDDARLHLARVLMIRASQEPERDTDDTGFCEGGTL